MDNCSIIKKDIYYFSVEIFFLGPQTISKTSILFRQESCRKNNQILLCT